MVIFSLTATRIGTPICAPKLGNFNDNVDLESLGFRNEDTAGYAFGFGQSNTQDSFVRPDSYLTLKWRPEYKQAEYREDFCFHQPNTLMPMNDMDDQAMCQHVFAKKHLRIDCYDNTGKCPEVANPFYQPPKSSLIQQGSETASAQEVNPSDGTYGSGVQPETTAFDTTGSNPGVIPDVAPGSNQPVQVSDADLLDSEFDLQSNSRKKRSQGEALTKKGKRQDWRIWKEFEA